MLYLCKVKLKFDVKHREKQECTTSILDVKSSIMLVPLLLFREG